MAVSSWNCSLGLIIITLLLCLPFHFHPSQSVSMGRRMWIGSRPPGCVNKCMSCHPCKATLVISPSHNNNNKISKREDDDSTYYLLSWKCRCRDQLFQP